MNPAATEHQEIEHCFLVDAISSLVFLKTRARFRA